MDGTISGTTTWSNITVPYVVNKAVLTIDDGGTLNLAEGVVIKSSKGRIDVRNLGTLNQGTTTVFTSYNDDSRLSDTNGDGAASIPADGDWSGVNLCKPLCNYATWANIFYAQKK